MAPSPMDYATTEFNARRVLATAIARAFLAGVP